MPKGFTDYEKERINSEIIEQGRRLFSTYGLKKTSIKEITKAVHISQGAFYIFYPSKEALYFKILELEEAKIKLKLSETISNDKDSVKKFLLRAYEVVDSNPFIRQVTFDDNMQELLRKLPEQELKAHLNRDTDALLPLFQRWQESGIRFNEDPEMVAALFRSIFFMALHKKEIGEAIYPKMIELLVNLVVDGLCREKAPHD